MSDQNERPGPSNTQRHSSAVPINVPMKALPQVVTEFLNAYKTPEKELTPDSGVKHTREDSNTSEDSTTAKIIYNAGPPRRGGITIVGKMHKVNLAPIYQNSREVAMTKKTAHEGWSSSAEKHYNIPSVLAQGHGASRKATIVPKRRISLLRENRSFPPILGKISSSKAGHSGLQSSIAPIHTSAEQLQQSVNLETRVGCISTEVKVHHDKPASNYQTSQEGAMTQKKTAHEVCSSLAKKHENMPSRLAQDLGTSRRITIVVPKDKIRLYRANRSFPPIVEKVSSSEPGPSGLQSSITPIHTSAEQLQQSVNLETRVGGISTDVKVHHDKPASNDQTSQEGAMTQKKTAHDGWSSSAKEHENTPSVLAQGLGTSRPITIVVPKNKISWYRANRSFPPIVEKVSLSEAGAQEGRPLSIGKYEPISPPSDNVEDLRTSSQAVLQFQADLQFSVNSKHTSEEQLFQAANLDTNKALDLTKHSEEGRPLSIGKYEPISPPSENVEDLRTSSQPASEFQATGSNLPEKRSYNPIYEPVSPPETGPSDLQFSVNSKHSSEEQLFQAANLDTNKAHVYSIGRSMQRRSAYIYRNSLESGLDLTKHSEEGRPLSIGKYEPISPPSENVEDLRTSSEPASEFQATGSNLPERRSYNPIYEQVSPPEMGPSDLQFSVNTKHSSEEQLFQAANLDTTKAHVYSIGRSMPKSSAYIYRNSLESGLDLTKHSEEGRPLSIGKYEPISPPSENVVDLRTSSQPPLEFQATGSNLPERRSYNPIYEEVSPPETGPSDLQFSVNSKHSSEEQLFQAANLDTSKAHVYSIGRSMPKSSAYIYQNSLESGLDLTKHSEEGRPVSIGKYEPISPPSENVEDLRTSSQPASEFQATGSNLPERRSYNPIYEQVSPPETRPSDLQFSVNSKHSSEEQLFQAANLDTTKAHVYSIGRSMPKSSAYIYRNSLESGLDLTTHSEEGWPVSIGKYEPISPPSENVEDLRTSSQPALEFQATGSNLPDNRSCTPIIEEVSPPKAGPSGLQFSKSPANTLDEDLYQADTFDSLLLEDIQMEMFKYDDEDLDILLNQEDQNIGEELLNNFQQGDSGEFISDLEAFINDYYASLTVEETQPPTIQCSSTEMVNPLTEVVKPSTSSVNSSSVSVPSNDGDSSLSAITASQKRGRKPLLPQRRGTLPGTYIQYRGFCPKDNNDVESRTLPTKHECLKNSSLTTDHNADGKGVEYKEEKLLASTSYDVQKLDLCAQDGLSEAVSCVRHNPDDVSTEPKNANIDNPEYIQELSGLRKRGRPRKSPEPIATRRVLTPGAPRPPRGRTIRSIEGFRATMTDLSHLLGHMRMPALKKTLPCGSKAYVGRGMPFKIPPAPEVQKVAMEAAALGNKIRKSHPSKEEGVVQDIVSWLMDNEEEEKYQQKNPEE